MVIAEILQNTKNNIIFTIIFVWPAVDENGSLADDVAVFIVCLLFLLCIMLPI